MSIRFVPSGRGKAQCEPNPEYPNGIDVDICEGKPGCVFDLRYPAPECGHFEVVCDLCKIGVGVSAAGRSDDPRTVKIPCNAFQGGPQCKSRSSKNCKHVRVSSKPSSR